MLNSFVSNPTRILRLLACTCVLATSACSRNSSTAIESSKSGVAVRAGDYGDKWPLTVAEGRIDCVTGNHVIFTAPDDTVYAVNGSARGAGRWQDVTSIWRANQSRFDATPVARIPESERRDIFADLVRCDDENRERPMTPGQNLAAFKHEVRSADRKRAACKARVDGPRKVTGSERDAISSEGIARGWPPLEPTRIDMSPLIERGLQMCQ